jgi:hypothetical protein
MDIVKYLKVQMEWSQKVFGKGKRTGGIIEHITKELDEIKADPDDLEEWIDIIILGLDGFWRHGGLPQDLMPMLLFKQGKNLVRRWPPPLSEDKATEHLRDEE